MCSEVIRKEGIFRLYFGMSPAIYRHVVYTGFRMTAYQHFRSKLSQVRNKSNDIRHKFNVFSCKIPGNNLEPRSLTNCGIRDGLWGSRANSC